MTLSPHHSASVRNRRAGLFVLGLVGLVAAVGMMLGNAVLGSAQAATGGLADLPATPAIVSCASLAGVDLSGATGAATTIAAKEIASPKGPFCRVTGTIAPAIGFEVDLPINTWTQRYLQTGCGGLCGNLNVGVEHGASCLPAANAGLVLASDDMGHQGNEADFGADPQKRIDFAYRGNHVTALAAKALIKAFYGRAPRYSYFSGCSDGGREALVEAERYPQDFDGIAAGAPALNFQVQNSFYHAWQADSNTGPDGKGILIASRLPILHRAVVAACDGLDGLKDGLISDPRACHFDPAAIQCADGASDTSNCLTAAEVGAARKLYAGPRDAAGHRFTIGGPQYGSELAWGGVYVPMSADAPLFSRGIASGSSQYVIFPEVSAKDGDIPNFAFTQANFERLAALHPLYDATDTDLGPFQARGGKLILWHGWADQHISPINTIAFYDAVKQTLGESKANSFLRLFLFAGMYHCGGGEGFSQFDVLTPLMTWVEQGGAPDRIIAAQVAPEPGPGGPAKRPAGEKPAPLPRPDAPAIATRPVFPYPQVARYTGSGDPKDAANFVSAQGPDLDPSVLQWAGAGFMGPDVLRIYEAKDGKLAVQPKS